MKISGWEPHKLREIALSVFIISVALLVICAALALISKPLNKLFPLPPQSEEHREYTNHANLSGGSATSETDPNQNQSESEKDKSPSDDENELVFIKDKRDLNAQEGMWRAANYLVVLTFFQIFIGLGTVILVWRTFWVQRNELDATNKANQITLQPYLDVTDWSLIWVGYPMPDPNPRITLDIEIENSGSSPAINFSDIIILPDTLVGYRELFWQFGRASNWSSVAVKSVVNPKKKFRYRKTIQLKAVDRNGDPTTAHSLPDFYNTTFELGNGTIDSVMLDCMFTFSDRISGQIRYMQIRAGQDIGSNAVESIDHTDWACDLIELEPGAAKARIKRAENDKHTKKQSFQSLTNPHKATV